MVERRRSWDRPRKNDSSIFTIAGVLGLLLGAAFGGLWLAGVSPQEMPEAVGIKTSTNPAFRTPDDLGGLDIPEMRAELMDVAADTMVEYGARRSSPEIKPVAAAFAEGALLLARLLGDNWITKQIHDVVLRRILTHLKPGARPEDVGPEAFMRVLKAELEARGLKEDFVRRLKQGRQ